MKLKNVKYVVDKLHIQGHTEAWCLQNCHPKLFPDLEPVNTVICEQVNFWLGRYKYIVKHMNIYRFNFFLYIILNQYNKIKINGKFDSFNQMHFTKKTENFISEDEPINISTLFKVDNNNELEAETRKRKLPIANTSFNKKIKQ